MPIFDDIRKVHLRTEEGTVGPSGTLKQDGKGLRGEIQLAYQHEKGLSFPGRTGNLIFPLGLGFLNFKWG